MEELPAELQDLVQERTLYVEDALRQERNEDDRYTCLLQRIAVEFVEGLPILPLTRSINYLGRCPHFPGVYLIYYVGETLLYGDRVSPSLDQPIYIGMSRNNILSRLRDQRRKIKRAKDLELEDFVVRFIIVKFYVPSVKDTLMKYFNPLWCNRTVGFSFGSAEANNFENKWNKYHVAKSWRSRRAMIRSVRDNYRE